MKTLTLTAVLLGFACFAMAQEAAAIQSGRSRPFVCTDYTQGKVFIVSAQGKVEWEYAAPNCNDLWVLANGNLLFNTGRGVKEITRENKVVFEYRGSPVSQTVKQKDGTTRQVESPSEIYACQRLPNGNTFIGECNSGRLLEVAPDGTTVKDVRLLPAGKDGGHAYMRNARRLANGHYLVAHYGGQTVCEYDGDGKRVMEIPAAGGPHSVARLANGHTLISCGDMKGGGRVFEADKDGKTVWEVKADELPNISLKFMSGFHRLPNGNTVMSNWLGHGQFGKAPHLIEVTPDKQVVWTFFDHKMMRTISNIVVLDEAGQPLAGEMGH